MWKKKKKQKKDEDNYDDSPHSTLNNHYNILPETERKRMRIVYFKYNELY